MPEQVQRLLESWNEDLKRVDALLVEGEGKKAYRKVTALIEEMADRFIGGTAVAGYLSTATVLRALAAYQLGDEDEALWHWHVAHQIFPQVADYTLSAYGDAGPFLKAHPPRKKDEPSPGARLLMDPQLTKRPKKLKDPEPRLPSAKRGGAPVSIIVQAIIGRDGHVRDPVILKSEGELTLVCATLDALRLWEFEPAEFDGKKEPVYFNLTVNFQP